MPHVTIIKPEFGELVKAIAGDLKLSQMTYKTNISEEYLRRMKMGHVPSEAYIQKFAEGMKADLTALRIAAGYEQPPEHVLPADDGKVHIRLEGIDPEREQEIIEAIRRTLEDDPKSERIAS